MTEARSFRAVVDPFADQFFGFQPGFYVALRLLPPLLAEVRELILQVRAGVARAVDAGLTSLYWHVGHRVRQDILKQKRAEYGGQIVSALGRQLEMEFGRGFSEKSLRHMIRFAETFPDFQIVSALLRQLSWHR